MGRVILQWFKLLTPFCILRITVSIERISHRNSSAILADLLVNYQKEIIPSKAGQPLDVAVQIYISDMVPLKQIHMHYSLDVFFRQMWVDERLAFNKSNNASLLILPGTIKDRIWIPDLYALYGKDALFHEATTLNSAIHVYGNGFIYYSQRLSLTSFCPMDFLYYPFDVQYCNFTISSYAYQADIMRLCWDKHNPILMAGKASELNMRQFSRVEFKVDRTLSIYDGIGNTEGAFYELTVMFTFYRNIAAYILRDYLPSILTVILSWLSFWIDYRSTPARVSLGITTVLTMVTLLIRTTSGGDSKIIFRSMDIYLFVCNMYVFSATIEYAIVGIIEARRVRRQVEAKNGKDNNNTSNVELAMLNMIAQDGSLENYLQDNFKVELPTMETAVVSLEPEQAVELKPEQLSRRKNLSARRPSWRKKKENYKNDIMLKLANIITYDMEKKMVEPHWLDKLCRAAFPGSFVVLNLAYFLFHYSNYP